jgi:peptide/nickel transport system permease protein
VSAAALELWVVALRTDAWSLLVVLAIALSLGLPLGAVAGSGPRWIDGALGFMTDWIGTLPAVLLLSFVRPEGASYGLSLAWLGLLRALELGWVVRSALLRSAMLDGDWALRSLGYMPLSSFVRERLPVAFRPALAHAALTPLWTFVLDLVGVAAGLGAVSSPDSAGALVARSDHGAITSMAAGLAVLLLTAALHVLARRWSLRLTRK